MFALNVKHGHFYSIYRTEPTTTHYHARLHQNLANLVFKLQAIFAQQFSASKVYYSYWETVPNSRRSNHKGFAADT